MLRFEILSEFAKGTREVNKFSRIIGKQRPKRIAFTSDILVIGHESLEHGSESPLFAFEGREADGRHADELVPEGLDPFLKGKNGLEGFLRGLEQLLPFFQNRFSQFSE